MLSFSTKGVSGNILYVQLIFIAYELKETVTSYQEGAAVNSTVFKDLPTGLLVYTQPQRFSFRALSMTDCFKSI